ncbi:MAG: hypothetical protein QI223_03980 [Candidatus Korarchaeota archaeon]|nr:hypothetical protein [Candidatus Korarchaeota archaeon]
MSSAPTRGDLTSEVLRIIHLAGGGEANLARNFRQRAREFPTEIVSSGAAVALASHYASSAVRAGDVSLSGEHHVTEILRLIRDGQSIDSLGGHDRERSHALLAATILRLLEVSGIDLGDGSLEQVVSLLSEAWVEPLILELARIMKVTAEAVIPPPGETE